MALSPDNIVVIYRQGDADSLTFAQAYQALHMLDDDQLIAVPCSDNEILVDYNTFYNEVESPLASVIFDPYYTRQVFSILVGYNVPGGFMDGLDVVSTSGRLSRMGYSFTKQTGNPLFNRQIFKFFDASDSTLALIVSRIDAPTLDIALNALNNTKRVLRQGSANGTFFFDKYYVASNFGADETGYENDLTDFQNTILPILNMPTKTTTYWDEYTDVSIPQLSGDSFLWAWGANRAGYNYFEDTRTSRVFLYNADADGAGAMRDASDKRFPMLAISSGYVGTAGAMSDPTTSGFLRPTPFFEALFRGASLGEAYIFSCPYVDWTMTLIGDPLISIKFPVGSVLDDSLTLDAGWDIMVNDMSTAIAYSYKRQIDYNTITDLLLNYTDQTKIDLFTPFANLIGYETGGWNAPYAKAVNLLLQIPTGGTSSAPNPLSAYLDTRDGDTISAIIGLSINSATFLPTSYLVPEGAWNVDCTITGSGIEYLLYNFDLEISFYDDFSVILYSSSTSNSTDNWLYEQNIGDFVQFPTLGVPSSYIGRRVRYVSPSLEYFDRCTIFYARIRQNDFSTTGNWQVSQQIVSS